MSESNFMNRFAVLDVETADNKEKGSICSIGIVFVHGNQIVDTFYSLINPLSEFNPHCIRVHGIHPKNVVNEPTFSDFWAEHGERLKQYTLVSYNAVYDMYSIERTMYNAGIQIPNIRYACAMKISKRLLHLEKYGLANVAEHFGIYFNHHNALEDAKVTTVILFELMKQNAVTDIKMLMRKARLPFEYLLTNSYDPANDVCNKPTGYDVCNKPTGYVESRPLRYGSSTHFNGKSVVFTGNLNCAQRPDAQQAVTAMGGICKTSVSKKTDIVIFGLYEQDTLCPGAHIGKKLEFAYELIEQGYQIEIMDENDFLEILNEGIEPQFVGVNIEKEPLVINEKSTNIEIEGIIESLGILDDSSLLLLLSLLEEELRVRNLV